MKLTEEQTRQLENEYTLSATRSSGPGGQNVNKVNSQVELRFSIQKSAVFSEDEKARISLKLANRINNEGELILTSQSGRSQLENKEKVISIFYGLIEKSLAIPKKRIKTTPTPESQSKRLESKKNQSQKKQLRKPPEL